MSKHQTKNLLILSILLTMIVLSATLNSLAAPPAPEETPSFIKKKVTDETALSPMGDVATMIIVSGLIPVNQAIPDNNPMGVSSIFTVPYNLMIDSVEVMSSVTHPIPTELEITLISPNQVKSVLARAQIDGNRAEADSATTRNLGQLAQGAWQLEVVDKRATNSGTFDNWQIVIRGKPVIHERYLPLLVRDVPIIIDPDPNVTPLTPVPVTPSRTPTVTPTPSRTPIRTPTNTGTTTPTPTITDTPTETGTPTPTGSPTSTNTPRNTNTPRPTRTPGPTPTIKPDISPTPTVTPVCNSPFDNNGFENRQIDWGVGSIQGKEDETILSPASRPIQLPVTPSAGEWSVWLGGYNSEINSVQQSGVVIPPSCPYITHRIQIQSYDPDCVRVKYPFNPGDARYDNPFFQFDPNNRSDVNYLGLLNHLRDVQEDSVDDLQSDLGGILITHILPNGDTEVGVGIIESDVANNWSLCNSPGASGWGQVVYNSAYFAGKRVSVEFRVVTNAQKESSMFMDNVTVQRTRSQNAQPLGNKSGTNLPVELHIFTIKATATPKQK